MKILFQSDVFILFAFFAFSEGKPIQDAMRICWTNRQLGYVQFIEVDCNATNLATCSSLTIVLYRNKCYICSIEYKICFIDARKKKIVSIFLFIRLSIHSNVHVSCTRIARKKTSSTVTFYHCSLFYLFRSWFAFPLFNSLSFAPLSFSSTVFFSLQ